MEASSNALSTVRESEALSSVSKSEQEQHSDDIITDSNDLVSEIDMQSHPIDDIIDYLAHTNTVCFKSQQIGETDLTIEENKKIALELFKKGTTLFISRFGTHLTENHLKYFEELSVEDNELKIIITQLQNMLCEKNRKIITKNRRYEALNKMIKDNSYFSEKEMMKRNPLLYDQLIGKYLSENEKCERDNIDTSNITLLNVLLESMERRDLKDALDKQRSNEDCQKEENSSDSESTDEETERAQASNWGEYEKRPVVPPKRIEKPLFVTAPERALLREEFVQEMYRSFLAGEDENIDYEAIDSNTEYDCLEVQGQDEEEQYFDSETPEEVEMKSDSPTNNETEKRGIDSKEESEDELDVYMEHLNKHPALKNVSQVL